MNMNDLPPAARLAALIEAGVAANPDLTHGRGATFYHGSACAIGFATLACGVSRERLARDRFDCARETLSNFGVRLLVRVVNANDGLEQSLHEICQSLREGELAKVAA